MALVLDTGPLVALLDASDADHIDSSRMIEATTEPLVIPAPVLVEVDYWIQVRLRPSVRDALLNDIISGGYQVEDLLPQDYLRIREICARYSDVGFVDAAVLAVVERLNERKLATLDLRHFRTLRPRHVDALRLLPADT